MALPKKKCFLLSKRLLLIALILCCGASFLIVLRYHSNKKDSPVPIPPLITRKPNVSGSENIVNLPYQPESYQNVSERAPLQENKMNPLSGSVNYNVHTFYYPWYGNPVDDSAYIHWNHEYIPNWDKNDKNVYPTGKHEPPDDIGANFYPKLGCYSSRNIAIIEQHMKWIQESGVGVLVITWYPPDQADKEGKPFDQLFPTYLDIAAKFDLKIAFHIEPYEGRSPENLRENLDYILSKYGRHPALYRLSRSGTAKPLPVFYIYDSYLTAATKWSTLLKWNGRNTIRGTSLDGIFLGLVVELRHKNDIVTAGFDGFYTYFAANEFTYGSSWKNWKSLSSFGRKNGLLFSPSVGPGYIDTRVRPWNSKTIRSRKNGKTYGNSWRSALQSRPQLVSITSFNEWHEGTQIEPAVAKSYGNYHYQNYQPNDPDLYLKLTRQFVTQFDQMSLAGS